MCKSPRAEQVWVSCSVQVWVSISLTYIVSLGIIVFYIMYNSVIVIGTNYFVSWNEFHITAYSMLKEYNSSLP